MYTLYIGNKNYSSWSLRGWLAAKLSGAPFREVLVQLRGTYNPDNRAFSPTALVPALHDGDVQVWDSLAIGEYLAERHPGMWPADPVARAWARSIAAEMHSGFPALRNDMTMCIRERVDVRPWSDALVREHRARRGDLDRLAAPLEQGRAVPVRRVLARRRVLRARRVPVPDLRRAARRARPASISPRCSRIRSCASGRPPRSRKRRSSTPTSRASCIATS